MGSKLVRDSARKPLIVWKFCSIGQVEVGTPQDNLDTRNNYFRPRAHLYVYIYIDSFKNTIHPAFADKSEGSAAHSENARQRAHLLHGTAESCVNSSIYCMGRPEML